MIFGLKVSVKVIKLALLMSKYSFFPLTLKRLKNIYSFDFYITPLREILNNSVFYEQYTPLIIIIIFVETVLLQERTSKNYYESGPLALKYKLVSCFHFYYIGKLFIIIIKRTEF